MFPSRIRLRSLVVRHHSPAGLRYSFGLRPRGGIEEPQLARLGRRLAFQELAHRVLDDIVDNICRGVIYPPSLADLRLLLDFGLMAFGEPDDLAQELLVHLAEDFGGKHREFVGALGIIEALDDI